jgi:16S rRNA (adenine1518-N6/adenine1519-N6)-dimethyltransferase
VLQHVTPSVAIDLLRRHRLRAGRRHGQHFLVDPNTVRRIVRLAGIMPDETILEIGPGLGSLTVALAEAASRVVAVEIDAAVAEALTEVVGDAANVEVVVGDAMETDLAAVVGGAARLVANLPYNVATPLLLYVLDDMPDVAGGLVMVQREVGERWTASPGSRSYGAVSVHVAFHADARIVGEVPPTVFLPPPEVASVLVEFRRRAAPPVDVDDARALFRFVRSAFGHRRKTLRNSLEAAGLGRAAVESALADADLEGRVRPEQLTLAEFARLYSALGAGKTT